MRRRAGAGLVIVVVMVLGAIAVWIQLRAGSHQHGSDPYRDRATVSVSGRPETGPGLISGPGPISPRASHVHGPDDQVGG